MFCDLPLSFCGLSVHCKACHRLRGSLPAVHAQAAGEMQALCPILLPGNSDEELPELNSNFESLQ